MLNTIFAGAALLGTTVLVQAVSNTAAGSAIVINKCSYDVYIHDVPAANEGSSEVDPPALKSGGVWSQHWTGLSTADGNTHDGWSIKLGKSSAMTELLQYEYTYQPTVNADIIWLDLSSVDGANNPWANDGWTLTTSKNCSQALQQNRSYASPTDNAAMQPECPADADITVILCESTDPGASIVASVTSAISSVESAVSSVVSSVLNPVPTTTSAAAPTVVSSATATSKVTTSAAPIATSSATSSHTSVSHGQTFGFGDHEFEIGSGSSTEAPSSTLIATPTTFVTAVSSAMAEFFGNTIIEVETAWITSIVTAEGPAPTEARKRHEHHHAAAHHHE